MAAAKAAKAERISTHPPREGRDQDAQQVEDKIDAFQPTRPVRGGTRQTGQTDRQFQPTRPVRGGTTQGA